VGHGLQQDRDARDWSAQPHFRAGSHRYGRSLEAHRAPALICCDPRRTPRVERLRLRGASLRATRVSRDGAPFRSCAIFVVDMLRL
jgi:hypothetical protein